MKCRPSSFPRHCADQQPGTARNLPPARIVSGDYYDFLSYGPEQVMIAVGDISGKGISAALADGDDPFRGPRL